MTAFLLTNATLATMDGATAYGLLESGAVLVEGDTTRWCGDARALPAMAQHIKRIDLEGRLLTPALIDCHTHLVFGGNRAKEFEMRLEGASYEEVARAGGGIVSTVEATRRATEEQLMGDAIGRLDTLIAEGVCGVEVKSGYGLDRATELKMLRVARRLAKERGVRVSTSYLGAHATPVEYSGCSDGYLDEVCLPALDAAHREGLIDAVDGFCENIAFSTAQIRRVFERARALGLPVKLHAEQLSHQGGTRLAAEFDALSVDHLEYATADDAEALAAAGSVAVLLPGAFYTLRETQLPPVEAFRRRGVPVAVATDLNPGSSPLHSLLLAMNMACTLFRLTPEEALAGTTRHAARALGWSDTGMIRPGLRADFAIWDVEHPAELAYRIGANPLYGRCYGGRLSRYAPPGSSSP